MSPHLVRWRGRYVLWNLHVGMVLASPPWGRRDRGSSILHYNPAMPIKNIIPGQTVTKEKLQRARELRRDMTPAEKILWQELRANRLEVHFRRQ